jgi:hypothetical protein
VEGWVTKAKRQQASSFDAEIFDQVEELIAQQSGAGDTGIPEGFEDELYGQSAKNDAEANYQRGQEMMCVLSLPGWKYIKEAFQKEIELAEQAHDAAETDADILWTHREEILTKKIVKRLIANVESSATVPHPNELPQ